MLISTAGARQGWGTATIASMRPSPAVLSGTAGVTAAGTPLQASVAVTMGTGFVPVLVSTRPAMRTCRSPLRETRTRPFRTTQGAPAGGIPNSVGPPTAGAIAVGVLPTSPERSSSEASLPSPPRESAPAATGTRTRAEIAARRASNTRDRGRMMTPGRETGGDRWDPTAGRLTSGYVSPATLVHGRRLVFFRVDLGRCNNATDAHATSPESTGRRPAQSSQTQSESPYLTIPTIRQQQERVAAPAAP